MRPPLAFAAFLSAALLSVGAIARADSTAQTFLARVKAEYATAEPKSETSETTLTASGLSGTQREVRRGADRVETTVLGPFTTVQGTVGGKNWHQNENGLTVLEEPEPVATTVPTFESRLTHVSLPHDVWLVTTDLGKGETQKRFYDPRDLAVVREQVVRGNHTAYVDYSDFRPWNGGKRRAWKSVGGDDRGNTYIRTMTRDDVAPTIDDAAFAIPSNRRTLVQFPEAVNQTKLPADVQGGRVYVKVEVNGNPLTFVLDTGASGIVLDSQAAKDIKLPSYGSRALTVAGTFASTRVIAPVVRIGDLTMRDVVMLTAPLDAYEGTTRVDGLLGYDFIASTVLRIDYIDPGSVIAVRPSAFLPPVLAKSVVPIRLNQQVPTLHVGVGESATDDMILDTGAQAPVIFFDRFVKAHPKAVVDEGSSVPFEDNRHAMLGVGGAVHIEPLRISSFRFADLDFRNYVVLRASDADAFNNVGDDGLLGGLFLRFYTLYVDYPDRKLYFEPNENYERGVGHPLVP